MRTGFILLLFCLTPVYGGFEQSYGGARPRSLGDAYVALGSDPWAMFYNPAGLTLLSHPEASFYYSPQPFGLRELTSAAAVIAIPFSVGVIGAGGRMYGFALYKETVMNVSFATTFSGIGMGVALSHYSVSIERYGSNSTLGVDVGLLVQVNPQIYAGMRIRNINGPKIGSSTEKLPQSFSTGVSYMPLQSLAMTVEYQKDLSFDASSKFGIEYWIVDVLAVRIGITDVPSEYHGGVGIRYNAFSLDYALSSHQDLGWTHEISFSVRWGGTHE